MTRNSIPLKEHQKDERVYSALTGIEGFDLNMLEKLTALRATVESAQRTEVRLTGELKAAHDAAVKAWLTYHKAILDAKDRVRGQFGTDSDELQSLGLKKKSEHKPPRRKPQTNG